MCNLAGYLGSAPPDIDKLKLLFILGRERGTDSCGMVINNERTLGYPVKDTNHRLKYDESDPIDFVLGNDFDDSFDVTNTVIMHSRKGVSSGRNVNTAHPYEYEYENGDKLYFMHNGTIHNELFLRSRYNIKLNDYTTDTDLMGLILYQCGFEKFQEALTLYEGFANFVWYWDNNPELVYIWKGGSLKDITDSKTKVVSKRVIEERPLHFIQDAFGLYFNSTEGALGVISNGKSKVSSFKNNFIFVIESGKLVKNIKIARKEEYYTYSSGTTYSYGYSPAKTDLNYKVDIHNAHNESKGGIYWFKGKYFIGNTLLDKIIYINSRGKIINIYNKHVVETLYFYKGYWIKDENAYSILKGAQPLTVSNLYFHSGSFHEKNNSFYKGESLIATYNDCIIKDYRFVFRNYKVSNGTITMESSLNSKVLELPSATRTNLDQLFDLPIKKIKETDVLADCIKEFNILYSCEFTSIEDINVYCQNMQEEVDDNFNVIPSLIESSKVMNYNILNGTSFCTKLECNNDYFDKTGIAWNDKWPIFEFVK